MSRPKDHEKALILRKQGMSYSQIKKTLNISKSTLSVWLKKYPLPEEKIRELRDWNEQKIERCRETKRKKKEKRLKDFYLHQKKIIFPINKHELYLAGLFLYWGEGAKQQMWELNVSNSDPAVIKFFLHWLIKGSNVPKNKIKIQLQLYKNMDIKKECLFWNKILSIPLSQFRKPYIKKSSDLRINHKGGFGHGTCNISIGDARLAERTLMGIKSIGDHYLKNSL